MLINTLCYKCADKLNLHKKNKSGTRIATCDVCGEEKAVSSIRDYQKADKKHAKK